jgi:hypothetical protein
MHLYLSRAFQRDAKRAGITDEHCRDAIRRAESGLIDADLGARLIKQRIPTGNRGAAKGSRAVVVYKRAKWAVFLHAFPKSGKANLSKSELAMYLKAAQEIEKLSQKEFLAWVHTTGWKQLET